MSEKVTLVNVESPTSVFIEIEVTGEGDLLFSGQEVGDAPRLFVDDSDYEYWLRIPAANKDQFLLALIEKMYAGNLMVITEVRSLLDAKGIPSSFTTF